jgi:hypothetical protein
MNSILDSIPILPGKGILESEEEKRTPFSYSLFTDDNGQEAYTVYLPKNLEQFADNWFVRTAIAATAALHSHYIVTNVDMEDPGVPVIWDEYFHGIASALKQDSIKNLVCSGKFKQGYYWVISQTKFVAQHKRFYGKPTRTPQSVLTGKEVWNKIQGGLKGKWYNLVLRAAQHKFCEDPTQFALKFEELKKRLFKTSWSFKNGAVFDEYEIKSMEDFSSQELKEYDSLILEAKHLSVHFMENFDAKVERFKNLLDWDSKVSLIGTQRASILYSMKMKKMYKKSAMSLSDRRELLTLSDLLEVTNSTGLLPGTVRIPLHIKGNLITSDAINLLTRLGSKINDQDTLGRGWLDWMLRVFREEEAQDIKEENALKA